MFTALIFLAAIQATPETCPAAADPAVVARDVDTWNRYARRARAEGDIGPTSGMALRPAHSSDDAVINALRQAIERRRGPQDDAAFARDRIWIGGDSTDVFVLVTTPRGCRIEEWQYLSAYVDAQSLDVTEWSDDRIIVTGQYRPITLAGGARRD